MNASSFAASTTPNEATHSNENISTMAVVSAVQDDKSSVPESNGILSVSNDLCSERSKVVETNESTSPLAVATNLDATVTSMSPLSPAAAGELPRHNPAPSSVADSTRMGRSLSLTCQETVDDLEERLARMPPPILPEVVKPKPRYSSDDEDTEGGGGGAEAPPCCSNSLAKIQGLCREFSSL